MILRRAFRIFSGRGARFLGAAVAFYAIASIAPLFVVVLHAVGAIFGRPTAEGTLFDGATFVLFYAFFKLLPDEHVRSRSAAAGAALSMALFALGSAAITAYVRHKLTADLYGAAMREPENQPSGALG